MIFGTCVLRSITKYFNLVTLCCFKLEKLEIDLGFKMDRTFKNHVISYFQLSGLSMRSDACDFLTANLSELSEGEQRDWLDKIIDNIQKQTLEIPVVEKEHIEKAITDNYRYDSEEDGTIFNIISAFEVPQFHYDICRKKFLLSSSRNKSELFDKPNVKGTFSKNRYTVLLRRTMRNRLFMNNSQNQIKLYTVDSLLSSSNKINNVVVLGMIAQLKEDKYFLEDLGGIVELDLTETTYHNGLFVETSFVLAEGCYNDSILHVQAIGLPPREPSEVSRACFASANTFGGPLDFNFRSCEKLKVLEKQKGDAMFVILSDVWLDQPKVLDKLGLLFGGYSTQPPTVFILMGNFLSSQKDSNHFISLRDGFRRLCDLISQFPEIANSSKFIIVPGPMDSPTANILPRPELPEFLVDSLKGSLKDVVLATNPCRIRYCTQEIVIIREDLVTKLCRNTIHFPDSKDIPSHFAKTIMCQATLVPMSLNVCPIYWGFDAALQLYPSPDLIVVGEQQKPFSTMYNNCQVINPGPFSKGEFTFKVYYPASRSIDDSQIPEDM